MVRETMLLTVRVVEKNDFEGTLRMTIFSDIDFVWKTK
jgi:hypothetical protein